MENSGILLSFFPPPTRKLKEESVLDGEAPAATSFSDRSVVLLFLGGGCLINGHHN